MGTKPKGSKAKAKREEPPLDDPNNWMSFADAFEVVYQHFSDRTLTMIEFADIAPRLMLVVVTGDPPRREKLRVKLDEIRPMSQALSLTKRQHVDVWRGAHRFILKATGQRGRLFVYKPDLKKYLPDVVGPAQKGEAEPQTPEPDVRSKGRMVKKDWVLHLVEALRFHHENPDMTVNAVADELDLLLRANGQKVPEHSKSRQAITWAFEFEDNPLKRPDQKGAKKGKSA